MKEYKSVCPYDCPDACGLIVSVENNRVVSVRGNRDHAFTRGTLCPKMAHYEQVVHSPLRLQFPMKRIGKKGVGQDQYVRISWDEAYDIIASNMQRLIKDYGNESIYLNYGTGTLGGTLTRSWPPGKTLVARLMNCCGGYLNHYGDEPLR